MRKRSITRFLAALLGLTLLGAACGDSGGSAPTDTAESTDNDAATQSTDETESASGTAGPIVPFNFDLYGLDRETGADHKIGIPAKFVDHNFDPVVDGDTAYVIGFEPIEGQSYTQAISIIKIDLTSNRAETLVDLGQNIENDESQDVVIFGPIINAGSDPWVVRDDTLVENKVLERYDGQTGDLLVEIPLELSGKIVSDESNLYLIGYDGIMKIDLATNAISLLQSDDLTLEDVNPNLDLAPYILTKSGDPSPEEHRDFLMRLNVNVSDFNSIATGGGRFWFTMSHFGISYDDESAIAEAIVEYDPIAKSVVALHPLNGLGGRFLPEDDSYDVSTISQAGLLFRDGYLFIADSRENGKLLRLDPATGLISEFYDPFSPDYDWFEIEFIETDPEGVWLVVGQATITEEDAEAGTRSSSIETYFVRIDAETGEELVSIKRADLFLFGS